MELGVRFLLLSNTGLTTTTIRRRRLLVGRLLWTQWWGAKRTTATVAEARSRRRTPPLPVCLLSYNPAAAQSVSLPFSSAALTLIAFALVSFTSFFSFYVFSSSSWTLESVEACLLVVVQDCQLSSHIEYRQPHVHLLHLLQTYNITPRTYTITHR